MGEHSHRRRRRGIGWVFMDSKLGKRIYIAHTNTKTPKTSGVLFTSKMYTLGEIEKKREGVRFS